jgi:hypothetical protein
MKRMLWSLIFGLVPVVSACAPMAAGRSERAGLGTRWGETRESYVSLVSFERDEPDRPIAIALLHYDDPDGVRALAREPPVLPGDAPGALHVRLVDDRGFTLPTFWDGGRVLVEGRRGQRYAIEISNGIRSRIEAVVTVDGLDVMDGERGSFAKRGYVLRALETYRVDGFRRSQAAVAAFRFGTIDESYASRAGDDTNVGVVGVAFFAERGARPADLEEEAARRSAADPFPDGFARPPWRGE